MKTEGMLNSERFACFSISRKDRGVCHGVVYYYTSKAQCIQFLFNCWAQGQHLMHVFLGHSTRVGVEH